jgi:hypothetical protein
MPSDTIKNPKEQVNSINLRSGKVLKPSKIQNNEKNDSEANQGSTREHCQKQCPQCGSWTAEQPSGRLPSRPAEELEAEKKFEEFRKKKKSFEQSERKKIVPYPDRLKEDEKEVSKFMEIFRKLHVNIPFSDLVLKVPRYARYLKEIMASKRKIPQEERVDMTAQCSVILTRQLPKKEKDPGIFTLPCEIGNEKFRGLCDLGASINIMPLSIYKRLNIGQMKHSELTLIMADKSEVKPIGMVEDVLVKVEHLLFPVDFIVMEVMEDSIPLILGRSFLRTSKAIIDVFKGQLTLEMGEEGLLVKVFEQDKEQEEGEILDPATPPNYYDDDFFNDEYISDEDFGDNFFEDVEYESFAAMEERRKNEHWEFEERPRGRMRSI